MFKGNPASALPGKDQPVHSMARTARVPEVADDHTVSLAGNLQLNRDTCPTPDGRGSTLITAGERKHRVNQTAFDWLLRDAPCKESLNSY